MLYLKVIETMTTTNQIKEKIELLEIRNKKLKEENEQLKKQLQKLGNQYENAFEIVTKHPQEIEQLKFKSHLMDFVIDYSKENKLTVQQLKGKFELGFESVIDNIFIGAISKIDEKKLMRVVRKLGESAYIENILKQNKN